MENKFLEIHVDQVEQFDNPQQMRGYNLFSGKDQKLKNKADRINDESVSFKLLFHDNPDHQ